MTRTLAHRLIAVLMFTATAAGAAGQPRQGSGGGAPGPRRGGPPQGEKMPMPAGMFEYVGAEIPLGPIVRGAPYSGDGVTTLTQTLGDGTHIARTTTAKLYRDSDGRIRREQTILGLGALAASGDAPTIVTIVDPVAGVQYVLDGARREAYRSAMPQAQARRAFDGAGARGRSGQAAGDPGGVPPPPPPPPPGQRREGPPPAGLPNVPQPLGSKQIEGVEAGGTRRTETIPAGRIGNDRPIVVTDERWESSELKVVLLSEHHDPRTGDVEYRLTNVSRSEPPRDLFTVPADYTVVDTPPPPPPPPPGRPDQPL
ncbi:MAG: hypothetical protein HY048_04175 [Acidobacteria bacterium]|nr:hypothetical protein [Acidobacteriota bacterium]